MWAHKDTKSNCHYRYDKQWKNSKREERDKTTNCLHIIATKNNFSPIHFLLISFQANQRTRTHNKTKCSSTYVSIFNNRKHPQVVRREKGRGGFWESATEKTNLPGYVLGTCPQGSQAHNPIPPSLTLHPKPWLSPTHTHPPQRRAHSRREEEEEEARKG